MSIKSVILAFMFTLFGTISFGKGPVKRTFYKSPYAKVAAQASPAVVGISYSFPDYIMGQVPPNVFKQTEIQRNVVGTGVFINSKGYILTAEHVFVMWKDYPIDIHLYSKDGLSIKVDGKFLVSDTLNDLALVKIDVKKKTPYLKFANYDLLQVGQEVVAIGHPRRLGWSVTRGIISYLHRLHSGVSTRVLQTDTALNTGNSGGPLLTLDGKIVGINFSILSTPGHTINSGIGFAIPSYMCVDFLDKHKELIK